MDALKTSRSMRRRASSIEIKPLRSMLPLATPYIGGRRRGLGAAQSGASHAPQTPSLAFPFDPIFGRSILFSVRFEFRTGYDTSVCRHCVISFAHSKVRIGQSWALIGAKNLADEVGRRASSRRPWRKSWSQTVGSKSVLGDWRTLLKQRGHQSKQCARKEFTASRSQVSLAARCLPNRVAAPNPDPQESEGGYQANIKCQCSFRHQVSMDSQHKI